MATTKKPEGQKVQGADYVPEWTLEESTLYSKPDPHIAMLTYNRAAVRNSITVAESHHFMKLYTQAETDPEVKVIICNANGPDFGTGDNLRQAPVESAGLRAGQRLALPLRRVSKSARNRNHVIL